MENEIVAMRYVKCQTSVAIIIKFLKVFTARGKSVTWLYPSDFGVASNALWIEVGSDSPHLVRNGEWMVCAYGRLEIHDNETFHARFKIDNTLEDLNDGNHMISIYKVSLRTEKEEVKKEIESQAIQYMHNDTTVDHLNTFLLKVGRYDKKDCFAKIGSIQPSCVFLIINGLSELLVNTDWIVYNKDGGIQVMKSAEFQKHYTINPDKIAVPLYVDKLFKAKLPLITTYKPC